MCNPVEYTYKPCGHIQTITAKQQNSANDQMTRYYYVVRTAGGSELNSNDLLAKVEYPDTADSNDNVSYQYNRQEQPALLRDQNGTIHTYEYDQLGRQTQSHIVPKRSMPSCR